MNKKKDTLVLHIARQPKTGVWTLIKELAIWQEQQSDLDSQIIIFCPKKLFYYYSKDVVSTNLKIKFFSISSFRYAYWFLLFDHRLGKYINNNKEFRNFKNIILQFHNADLSGLFLPIKTLRNINIRTVAVFHGTPLVFPSPSKIKLFAHQTIGKRLKYADKLVSVSEKGVIEASKIFSYDPNKFVVIPNGIADPGVLHERPYPITKEAPFIVGFIGSLTSGKRWDLIVEAVKILRNKGFPVKAIIAGTGPDEPTITQLAKNNQSWLEYRGFVPNAGKLLMPYFDVFVLPSSYEGVPMTIIEAMACGVPVIATGISDIPNMIIGSLQAGYIVKQDALRIADCIEQLMNNPYIYHIFSQNARLKYIREYSIEICGKRYNNLYYSFVSLSFF